MSRSDIFATCSCDENGRKFDTTKCKRSAHGSYSEAFMPNSSLAEATLSDFSLCPPQIFPLFPAKLGV